MAGDQDRGAMNGRESHPNPKRDIRRSISLPDEEERLKASWGDGPWQDEPDLVEWRHADYPGLALLAVRAPMGAWCGYVGVPPGHALHGKDWGDIDGTFDVHGGLTFSDRCTGHICHVPGPGEPDDVWWLGFDCAHAWIESALKTARGRLKAGLAEFDTCFSGMTSYKDMGFIMAETESLAEQIAKGEAGA